MDQTPLSTADIEYVNELVRKAGKMALEMREGVEVKTKSGPNDFVTAADLSISHMVSAALTQRFPADLIVSEEDVHQSEQPVSKETRRIWLIDPIDGTENYVKRDGQYSSMIGLVAGAVPTYGWIYQPTEDTLFAGGSKYGAWKTVAGKLPVRYADADPLSERQNIRLLIGWGDRRRYPWLMEIPNVTYVPSDSFGLKIMKILEKEADLFVSLTGRVKLWDTAAAAAIAIGNGMDVGTADGQPLPFPVPAIQHGTSMIIGLPGAVAWGIKNIDGQAIRSVS
jgi:3'(2'), 5'-bisphosphate nucleotidase